jgi:hypothetical protein
VIHRTFRSLDEAPKLVGFTVKQWAVLIVGGGLLIGVIHLAHVPTKPAITLCVFVIGLPAALTYVSESGGLQLSVLLRSMWRWRFSTHTLADSSAGEPCRARGVLVLGEEQQAQESLGQGSPVEPLEDMAWERWG